MEKVGRSGTVHNLHIEVGTQTQEPFQTAAGMFCTLSLIAMRQQHDQSRLQSPFFLCCGNILIHNYLSHVIKITKLRLPQGKSVVMSQRVTIFETQYTIFIEWRIIDPNRLLLPSKAFQWEIFLLAVLGNNLRVAV